MQLIILLTQEIKQNKVRLLVSFLFLINWNFFHGQNIESKKIFSSNDVVVDATILINDSLIYIKEPIENKADIYSKHYYLKDQGAYVNSSDFEITKKEFNQFSKSSSVYSNIGYSKYSYDFNIKGKRGYKLNGSEEIALSFHEESNTFHFNINNSEIINLGAYDEDILNIEFLKLNESIDSETLEVLIIKYVSGLFEGKSLVKLEIFRIHK